MIKELFKDLTKYLPSMIVPAVVGIVALPIITRLFPPADYGNYIVVTTTVAVFSILAVAWLGSSMSRFFPIYEQRNEIVKFYSTILKATLLSISIFFFVFWGILYLAQSYISPSVYSLMRIGVLLFIGTSFLRVFSQILRARRLATWYSFFSIWHSIIGVSLGIALVMIFHFEVEGLLLGSFLSIAMVFPLLWKVSIGKPSLKEGSIRSPMTWEIAKFGIPAIGINLLTWALSLSDRYILQFFKSSYEVGIYSASYGVSERSIFLITSLFLLPSAPIAYRIWEKEGVSASQEFIQKLTRYYLLISLPASIGLSVLAKPIAGVLFAPEYLMGYRIIPLVSLGALLVGLAQRFSLGLGYYKRTDLNMLCFLGATLLNVGLNFAFIPRYSYMGAAATTFVSYSFLLLLEIVVSRRFFVWEFPFKSLTKVTCASGVMAVLVYQVGNSLTASAITNIILGVCIGMVVYAALLFLLGEIRPNEIRALLALRTDHAKERT